MSSMAGFEQALAKWPKASVRGDGSVHVTGKYVSPRLDAGGFILALIGGAAASIITISGKDNAGFGDFLLLALFWTPIAAVVVYLFFRKNVDVKIYHDRIAVRHGLFGYKEYSREVPIEFRVEQHHLALTERGNATVYRNAIEAVMQYGEKRIPLAEMPHKKLEEMRALVIRLQNVCASVDASHALAPSGNRTRASDFGPAPDVR
jgi:hypothetical protein